MAGPVYDLAIIGGGINGCGIARDAAGRGLSVYLCEQGDLASGTSSASTKLIHGGLRYLEHYAFRLVREALAEREVLLANAPHIIRPLRFVLPHHAGLRPRWLLRLGLFLYDHLGGRRLLPATRTIDLRTDPAGAALKPEYVHAFEYSDCWVEDARLVVLNAVDAHLHGASINPRTRCVSAERKASLWQLSIENSAGARRPVAARALVNAAGPWVAEVLQRVINLNEPAPVRLVKGSHIVVRRLFEHDRAYIFQNSDGRILFAIPFEQDFTLLGTTDDDYRGNPADVAASSDDIAYICAAATEYFRAPVTPADVVWTYAGVRPLYDDGASKAQEATRDYVVKVDAPSGAGPLVTVFGGKITTYRRLSESVLSILARFLPVGPTWTAKAPLPGGDFPVGGGPDLVRSLHNSYPFLEEAHLRRLVRSYGTRTGEMLNGARSYDDLGRSFGADLTEAEVSYLTANEWAETAADVLWRRSRLGLHLSREEQADLDGYMQTMRERPRRAAEMSRR